MKFIKKLCLVLLLVSSHSFAKYDSSYITMYSFKSPYGIDWSTPSTLALSAIKNSLAYRLGITDNRRNIGHSAIKVSCNIKEGERKEFYTGMGAVASNKEAIKLLWNNSALGVLLHRYKGKLDTEAGLISDIEEGQKTGAINSVTYLIDDAKCEELNQHFDEWKKRKAYLNYGLIEKPLDYTGAGCSAYAVSYLRLNGIAPEEHKKEWKRTVHLSNALVGAYNRLPYINPKQEFHKVEKSEKGANLLELILNADQWASAKDEQAIRLDFWSPDMMHDWTKRTAEQHQRTIAKKDSKALSALRVEKTSKSVNLVFDRRNL